MPDIHLFVWQNIKLVFTCLTITTDFAFRWQDRQFPQFHDQKATLHATVRQRREEYGMRPQIAASLNLLST